MSPSATQGHGPPSAARAQDDASAPNSPAPAPPPIDSRPGHGGAGSVPTPGDKEEWNDFVMKYASGSLHSCSFPLRDRHSVSPTPSSSNGKSKRERQRQRESGRSRAAEGESTRPTPTHHSSAETAMLIRDVTPRSAGGSGSGPGSRKGSNAPTPTPADPHAFRDRHPDTSASGAMNQDPDIPNISSVDLPPVDAPKAYRASSRASRKDDRELTAAHVDQLNENQKVLEDAERERMQSRNGGDPGPSSMARRAPLNVRMEERRAAHSVGSSQSDEEARPQQKRPAAPRSRGSYRGVRQDPDALPIDSVLESATGSSATHSHTDIDFDYSNELERVRQFFTENGYMPAPRQPPDAARRRLRVIRRLGLEQPDQAHRTVLDRFTRLAVNIFKVPRAVVSVIGRDRQIFLSAIGFPGVRSVTFDEAFCCHTILNGQEACMVVPNASEDWRFQQNPHVKDNGAIQFYAGTALRVGEGSKAAIIGSMCVIDDKPRDDFGTAEMQLLKDLGECAVSEMELLYNQTSTHESSKLHQISVDFLRRSLKQRPAERAGLSMPSLSSNIDVTTDTSSTSGKRKEGADAHQIAAEIDIFDEACSEIRTALDAYAVAIVDLSQFHLFYPTFQTSTSAGSTRTGSRAASARDGRNSRSSAPTSRPSVGASSEAEGGEAGYDRNTHRRAARSTYAVKDPMAPSRHPQVLFMPTAVPKGSKKEGRDQGLGVLGYSSDHDGFAFNFASTPAARKIVCDFIAHHVKDRSVWYTRDDSEGIAQSITHLMPPGTETSLAMPVFGFDGQVAFAVVACWTDPLYTYPAGALQFVETIAGSLLASVMKEKLHQAERAQLNFAAAASHELRTPLHQINAAAALLRQGLPGVLQQPGDGDSTREDVADVMAHLEMIEANGLSLGQILENIIDTLDIGRVSSNLEETMTAGGDRPEAPLADGDEKCNLADLLERVVKEAVEMESRTRRIAGVKGLEEVEVILELMPRMRGRWLMAGNPGPLIRALSKVVHNACKFTDKGYVHITVQDLSRDVSLPTGYDNPIKRSEVAIDIKDSGRGMTPEFLQEQILQPFAKADPFMQGSGLGLNLAQRMIELLAGKLAIKSAINKGTLVHIEIPLHLYSVDNDSDQEELEEQSRSNEFRPSSPVRKDGIYVHGFDRGSGGARRVGRVLVRQLKLRGCRVVETPHYASLVVVPESESVDEEDLKRIVKQARPGAEVIRLVPPRLTSGTGHGAQQQVQEKEEGVVRIERPLLPSVLSVITRAKDTQPGAGTAVETYRSDVVGGAEATAERMAAEAPAPGFGTGSGGAGKGTDTGTGTARGVIEQAGAGGARLHPSPGPSRATTDVDFDVAASSWARSSLASDADEQLMPSPVRASLGLPLEDMEMDLSMDPDWSSGSGSGGSLGGGRRGSSIGEADADADADAGAGAGAGADEGRVRVGAGGGDLLPPFRPPMQGQVSDPGGLSLAGLGTGTGAGAGAPGGGHGEGDRDGLARSMQGLQIRPGLEHAASLPMKALSDAAVGAGSESLGCGRDGNGDGQVDRRVEASEGKGKGKGKGKGAVPAEDDRLLRVLVVEDNPVNRRILVTMLKRTACHYAEAVDGNDAVRQFKAFLPDLVLLDINMPGKDGFQASAEMRAIEAEREKRWGMMASPSPEVSPVVSPEASPVAGAGTGVLPALGDATATATEAPVASTPDMEAESKDATTATRPMKRLEPGRGRARIVAVTALSGESARRRGMIECGIDEWRTKPVSIKELREDVERMKL